MFSARIAATLIAFISFVAMFAIYTSNHPAGFSANVVQTAANKGVLLALVAMAQTFVVITAGIDLSVGVVFVLTNCLASWIVVGTAPAAALGVVGVLLTGLACGAINGLIVIFGRLQPIVTTIATGAIFFGLALHPAADAGRRRLRSARRCADGPGLRRSAGEPHRARRGRRRRLGSHIRRSDIGRAAYAVGSSEQAAYMSGRPVARAKFFAYVLSGLAASLAGLFLTFITYSGEASAATGGSYTLFSIAAVVLGGVSLLWRFGQRNRRDFRRADVPHDRRPSVRLQSRSAVAAAVSGPGAARRRLLGAARLFQVRNRLELFAVSHGRAASLAARVDRPVAVAFGCVIALLLVGSLYSRSFLSPEYLLQQLKVASFLGVIATGTMIVILLGQIDLSVPWVVAVGGMMSTAATGWGPVGESLAIPFGIACGIALGLVNGYGVAYLRIPSMIVTLAVNAVAQGLMVVHTGGFSPQDSSSPAMRALATGDLVAGLPNALIVWAVIGAGAVFLLNRTTFGRAVYGIGNRERAAYLSGVPTQRIVLIAFAHRRRPLRLRRRAARRLRQQGCAGHGRRLSVAGDRRGGARRRLDPRRPRQLYRHGRGRHPDHAPAIDPVGHADAGRWAPDHLRRRHHRDAAALRT